MRVNAISQNSNNKSFGSLKVVGDISRGCRQTLNAKVKPLIPEYMVDLWNRNGYDVVLQKLGDEKNAKMFDLRVVHKAWDELFVSAAWISLESEKALKNSTRNIEKSLRKEFVEWAKKAH